MRIKIISESSFENCYKKETSYLVPSVPLRVVEVGQVNLLEGLKEKKYSQSAILHNIFNFPSVFQVRSFVNPLNLLGFLEPDSIEKYFFFSNPDPVRDTSCPPPPYLAFFSTAFS
jgi:hypothetical protein